MEVNSYWDSRLTSVTPRKDILTVEQLQNCSFRRIHPFRGELSVVTVAFCVIAIPCNHSPKPLLLISIEKINWSNKFGIVRIITLVFRGSLFLGYISICMSQLLRKKRSVIQFTHMCIGIKYIPGPLLLHVILFQHHGHSLVW